MAKIPIRLNKDPIIEALFEMRFKTHKPSAADLFPGLLYPHVSGRFPNVENFPHASFQRDIAKQDPNLRYKPTLRMVGTNSMMLIGDNVFTFSYKSPYPGWDTFHPEILELCKKLQQTELISEIERFSIKYINILPQIQGMNDIKQLQIDAKAGPYDLCEYPTHFRTEIVIDDFINLVNIAPRSHVNVKDGKSVDGLLVDIDTIYRKSLFNNWDLLSDHLNTAHRIEKDIFFGVLTEETINRLDPVWE